MKKIMFNDKYGLTRAVLEGSKTMTRRVISPKTWEKYCEYEMGYIECQQNLLGGLEDSREYLIDLSPYKVGEVIAIAQKYNGLLENPPYVPEPSDAGWRNKMFVKAELMPHHIKITDIKVERLQDISDEDCLREGIQHCETCYEAIQLRVDGKYHFKDCGYCFKTPREAFAALIDKVGKKGTWQSDPWCFCYSFELVD